MKKAISRAKGCRTRESCRVRMQAGKQMWDVSRFCESCFFFGGSFRTLSVLGMPPFHSLCFPCSQGGQKCRHAVSNQALSHVRRAERASAATKPLSQTAGQNVSTPSRGMCATKNALTSWGPAQWLLSPQLTLGRHRPFVRHVLTRCVHHFMFTFSHIAFTKMYLLACTK